MKNGRWETIVTPLLALFLMAAVALLVFAPFWFGPKESPRQRSERKLFVRQVDEIQRGKSTQLWFYETEGVDAYLNQAAALPAMKSLELDRTDITDAGVQSLSRAAGLQELNIRGGRITAQGIEQLALCKNLEHLELAGVPITAGGIGKLSRLPKLRTFIVNDKRIK